MSLFMTPKRVAVTGTVKVTKQDGRVFEFPVDSETLYQLPDGTLSPTIPEGYALPDEN